MSKVIVERPRAGRAWADLRPGRTRALVDDDGEPIRAVKPAREGKRKTVKTKALNETLNPLKRYLASNVDRPWNKVYSEISEHLKPTSTVQQHVRDHLDDFVATKTRMKAGQVMVTPRYGGERPLNEDYSPYYVHPRTGLLRKNQHYASWNARQRARRAAVEAELAARMRIVDESTQLHMFDGGWWEVKLAKVKRRRYKNAQGRLAAVDAPHVDVVHRAKLSELPGEKLYAVEGVYAVDKRPLSKVEMKRLGLR